MKTPGKILVFLLLDFYPFSSFGNRFGFAICSFGRRIFLKSERVNGTCSGLRNRSIVSALDRLELFPFSSLSSYLLCVDVQLKQFSQDFRTLANIFKVTISNI